MDCEQYLERMSAALDGECTAEERRALDDHLAVCPACAELFRTLSANARAARELDCDVPADLKTRIMRSLPEQEKPARQGKVIRWKRWVPVAAAACLVLVVSLLPVASNGNAGEARAPAASFALSGAYENAADTTVAEEPACVPSSVPVPIPSQEPPASVESSVPQVYGETDGTPEPGHYWFGNQQAIRVHYSATPQPGAVIVGSTDSLNDYLGQFGSLAWDAEGNTVPIAGLEALAKAYPEEFFRTGRLLCIVIESGSGSNRYEIAAQGLLRSSVTILEKIPEVGTCDMAAWLLVAEVDSMFDDGDILEVNFIR